MSVDKDDETHNKKETITESKKKPETKPSVKPQATKITASSRVKECSEYAKANVKDWSEEIEIIEHQLLQEYSQHDSHSSDEVCDTHEQEDWMQISKLVHTDNSNLKQNSQEQGFCAYSLFDQVVKLDENIRLNDMPGEDKKFLNLLQSLRKGNCSEEEWRLLLARQPSQVSNLSDFKYSTRLFFKNESVADYTCLKELNQPLHLSMPNILLMKQEAFQQMKCLDFSQQSVLPREQGLCLQ
eukprot:gene2696-3117_t